MLVFLKPFPVLFNCSSGGTLTNGNLSITFVLGEVVGDLQTSNDNRRYLSTGFVQPDIELKEILDRDISRYLTIFPNPSTNGNVKLAFNNVVNDTYTIDVIDAIGRILQTKTVIYANNNFLYVDMNLATYANGTYFIRVHSKANYKGQVKVIKQ